MPSFSYTQSKTSVPYAELQVLSLNFGTLKPQSHSDSFSSTLSYARFTKEITSQQQSSRVDFTWRRLATKSNYFCRDGIISSRSHPRQHCIVFYPSFFPAIGTTHTILKTLVYGLKSGPTKEMCPLIWGLCRGNVCVLAISFWTSKYIKYYQIASNTIYIYI